MDLIYYRGLNCHLASIINIANALGVKYTDAFATLWSEMDFTDKVKYNIYVSKRVFINLEAIGVMTQTLDCDEMKTGEDVSRIPDGEMFVVGMDTFYIPWHPVFDNFHDPHYFFAQKETANSFLCFDPVYNEKNKKLQSSDILSSAFELSRIYKIDASPPENGLTKEAGEVLRSHPEAEEKLLAEILKCGGEGKNNIAVLIKQINAMINNRYLFRRFVQSSAFISGRHESFFNEAYLLKWEAVRNGLYKASVLKDNKSVIDEVYGMFADLMHEEITVAKEIVSAALKPDTIRHVTRA